MQWAPLNPDDFRHPDDLQTFTQLRRRFHEACVQLLTRASPQLERSLAECKGCTQQNCPLHTGALLLTAQTLLEGDPTRGVSLQWCPALSLAAARRAKLLRRVFGYTRTEEVCVVLLIPSYVLAPLMRPECVPSPGLRGMGTVPLADMARGLVTLCFQEVMAQLPPGATSIGPDSLPVDPTNPEKQPVVSITGLTHADGLPGPIPHGCLPEMPGGVAKPGIDWQALKGWLTVDVLRARGGQVQGEGQQGVVGGSQANGCMQGAGGEEQCVSAEQGTGEGEPVTAAQQRLFLQATINKFWMTANSLAPRLANRAHKIRCKDRIACDGSACDYCRGAMVFTVSRLEGPNKQPWVYRYRGQDIPSNTPKQYMRGEWTSVYDLVDVLGCMDMELIRTVTLCNRKSGYCQVLHIPYTLISTCLPQAPPCGLFFWRLSTPSPPQHPQHPSPTPQHTPQNPLPPIKSEYSYKSEMYEDGSDHEDTSIPAEPPVVAAAGPRVCGVAGCGLSEERYTGVQLLVCGACKGVWYCSGEHQRADWGAHKAQCGKQASTNVQ